MRIIEIEVDEDTFDLVVRLEKAFLRWKKSDPANRDHILDEMAAEVESNPMAVFVHGLRPPRLFTDYNGRHKLDQSVLH